MTPQEQALNEAVERARDQLLDICATLKPGDGNRAKLAAAERYYRAISALEKAP